MKRRHRDLITIQSSGFETVSWLGLRTILSSTFHYSGF